MIRLNGSLVGGSNVLTWQDEDWQHYFDYFRSPNIFLFYLVCVIQNLGATSKGNVDVGKGDNVIRNVL